MKIKRVWCGFNIEFELTEDELYDAYIEQQEAFDRSDCENGFELEYGNEEWFHDVFNNKEVMKKIIEKMAPVHRKNMDKYDMDYNHSIVDAARDPDVLEIIEEYRPKAKVLVFKGIVFDDFTQNAPGDGFPHSPYWAEICESCVKEQYAKVKLNIDDGGDACGCCSVKGCNNTGYYYIDFFEGEFTIEEEYK